MLVIELCHLSKTIKFVSINKWLEMSILRMSNLKTGIYENSEGSFEYQNSK